MIEYRRKIIEIHIVWITAGVEKKIIQVQVVEIEKSLVTCEDLIIYPWISTNLAVVTSAFRETRISRHNGGSIVLRWFKGFQWGLHY